MKIQERITTLTEEIKDDNTTSLWRVCRGIVENVSQHNKQIIAQMHCMYILHQETWMKQISRSWKSIKKKTQIMYAV